MYGEVGLIWRDIINVVLVFDACPYTLMLGIIITVDVDLIPHHVVRSVDLVVNMGCRIVIIVVNVPINNLKLQLIVYTN